MELNNNGAIRISDEVIADIAIKASLEVSGVVGVRQGVFDGARNLVSGNVTIAKGVTLAPAENGIDITVQIAVRFGCKIQEVCAAVQQEVAEAVTDMTGIAVRRVNVAVVGIVATRGSRRNSAQ